MRTDAPTSPLRPVTPGKGGQLSIYQAIGLVTDLAINHSMYNQLTVESCIETILLSFEQGQGKIFLDEGNRPYGFASWIHLCDEDHQNLLTHHSQFDLDANKFRKLDDKDGTQLWFFEFLSPFATPLFMLRLLKNELKTFKNAHLLQRIGEGITVRELW
ncbi:toxin-activating lysine-acyltransferase [Reinekea forsetii]|jgi:hemolysin-activating ACP:hemolysin acyltransferase|uniref:RTX toxin-activating lysine-acyltransferase n=1 Tax=Reinekea forsetii TaxID=1336806 RepID=A0A2K8KLU7_9GAMM|nr:toxin-activating lysine-acyltransferase [Reinekea forsetii]ATX75848.1 RTX toxin activating lysine-acyltransferase [Reinekea forsetii]